MENGVSHNNKSVHLFGGTILMGENKNGNLEVFYNNMHALLGAMVASSDLGEEEKQAHWDTLAVARSDNPEAKGLLEGLCKTLTGSDSLDDLPAEFGLVGTQHPLDGYIDSIDYQHSEHFLPLYKSIVKAIEVGETPILVGGTDSMEFYSTAITEALTQQGVFDEYPESKVVFLSSMRSFEEQPGHVSRLVEAAFALADDSAPELKGGLVLSANDEACSKVHVHNALNGLCKISAHIINSFRTRQPIGTFATGEGFAVNPDYQTPPLVDSFKSPKKEPSFATVVPPLLRSNSAEDIASYLVVMKDSPAIIEAPRVTSFVRSQEDQLLAAIADRTRRGIATVIVNDHFYIQKGEITAQEEGHLEPLMTEDHWQRSAFLQEAREVGALTWTGMTTIRAYNKLSLALGSDYEPSVDNLTEVLGAAPDGYALERFSTSPDVGAPKAIGLQSIPDAEAFAKTMNRLSDANPDLVVFLQTLNGYAIPQINESLCSQLLAQAGPGDGPKFAIRAGVKYAGMEHQMEDGSNVTEGDPELHGFATAYHHTNQHAYQTASWVSGMLHGCGTSSPSSALTQHMISSKIDASAGVTGR